MKVASSNGKKCAEAPIQPSIRLDGPEMANPDKSQQLTFKSCATVASVNGATYELIIAYFQTETQNNGY